MFKTEKDMPVHETETVIAASVRVEGDFVSQGNVRIEGTVSGSIATERDLYVGEQAHITANVCARNATLAGEVHGNLKVYDRLELAGTARVFGDIQAKVLSVAPGASMRGQLVIGQEVPVGNDAEAPKAVVRANRSAREKKIEELLQQEAAQ